MPTGIAYIFVSTQAADEGGAANWGSGTALCGQIRGKRVRKARSGVLSVAVLFERILLPEMQLGTHAETTVFVVYFFSGSAAAAAAACVCVVIDNGTMTMRTTTSTTTMTTAHVPKV